MNAPLAPRRPAMVVIAALLMLVYATVKVFGLVFTAVGIAARVFEQDALMKAVDLETSGQPLWILYAQAGLDVFLAPALVVGAIGLLTGERWALRLARGALLVALLAILVSTLVGALAAVRPVLEDHERSGMMFGLAGGCCCNILPVIILVILALPSTEQRWLEWQEAQGKPRPSRPAAPPSYLAAGGHPGPASPPSPPSPSSPPPQPPKPPDVWTPPST